MSKVREWIIDICEDAYKLGAEGDVGVDYDALFSGAPPEVLGWVGIGSAPKDGTHIIAFGKFHKVPGWTGYKEELGPDDPVALGKGITETYFMGGNWQTGGLTGFIPEEWQPMPRNPQDS